MQEIDEDKREEEIEEPKKNFVNFLVSFFDFIKTIAVIVILAFVIRVLIIQPFIVEGESMEPTFKTKDYLITEKVSYRFRPPQRGEVVIFNPPDRSTENYIKRIIGLPGDQIEIKEGNIYVNKEKLIEPYLNSIDKKLVSQKEGYTTVLKDNEYFVMGDNRSHSRDSREIGSIPKQNVVSKVWFRLLPLDQVSAFAAVDYKSVPQN